MILNFAMDATSLAPTMRFDDYESFVTFMEQDVDTYIYNGTVHTPTPNSAVTYYDQYGNEISEEEALYRELTLADGTVVCTYYERNNSVSNIRYSEQNGSLLPIATITFDALRIGQQRLDLINGAFAVFYGLQIGMAALCYCLRRKKL